MVTATDPTAVAMLQAIVSEPGDDTPRLVYADWLDEHDQPARAEFIRVQVELAKLPEPEEKTFRPIWVRSETDRLKAVCVACSKINGPELCRYHTLYRASWILLRGRHFPTIEYNCWPWMGVTRRLVPGGGLWTNHVEFSRGFVSHVTCTAADWLAHADTLFWSPIPCSRCGGGGSNRVAVDRYHTRFQQLKCTDCDGSGLARPFPPTAQPIERVTLTTPPSGVTTLHPDANTVTDHRWPGITFELPRPHPTAEAWFTAGAPLSVGDPVGYDPVGYDPDTGLLMPMTPTSTPSP